MITFPGEKNEYFFSTLCLPNSEDFENASPGCPDGVGDSASDSYSESEDCESDSFDGPLDGADA